MGNSSKKPINPDSNEIYGYLESMEMFKNENPKQLAKISSVLRIDKFVEGDTIIKQGAESNYMFIIAKGEVSFLHMDPITGIERVVHSIGEEDTCGEFGLVFNVRRTAAAIATSAKVIALRLDRDVYDKIKTTKYMKPLTQKVDKVCANLMRDGLASLPMMGNIDKNEIEEICHLFKFEVIPKGTKLIQEGDNPRKFYLIHEGAVVVTRIDEYTLPDELARLSKGEGFGERALLSKGKTEATVTTLSTCELFTLDRNDFKQFVATMSKTQRSKLIKASYSIALRDSVPIFKHLRGKSLDLLSSTCNSNTFQKGEVIITENTTKNKKVSVIISGKVVVKQKGKVINTLTSGYFGEASMFAKSPSNGTVIASTNLQLLQIPLDAFKTVLESEPIIYSEVALRVLGKNVPLAVLIQHPIARQRFFVHCQKEFSEESLLFLEEVRRLENLAEKSLEPDVEQALSLNAGDFQKRKEQILRDKARSIYSEYILAESPREINISAIRKNEMQDLIDTQNFYFRMYSNVKEEILNLVEQDTFARFKDSYQFQTMLDDIGIYTLLS